MTTPPHSDRRSGDKRTAIDTESLRQTLLMILGHLFDLHLLGSQAHGHFIGTDGFPDVRVQLDGIVQVVREATDTIVERLRALDAGSHRRLETSPGTTTLVGPPGRGTQYRRAMLDRITHRIVTVVDIIRSVHKRVATTDMPTADLLRVMAEVLERQGRLLKSQEPKSERHCEFGSQTYARRAMRPTHQS
jgi:starvation-inducible DNA-binding protein